MDLNPHFEFQPSAQHSSSSSSYHQSSRRPANSVDSNSQHPFGPRASTSSVPSRPSQDASPDDNNPYFEFKPSTSSSRPWVGSQRRASGGGRGSSYNSNASQRDIRPSRSISPVASFQQRRPQASNAGGWGEIEKAAGGGRSSSTRTSSLSPSADETALGAAIAEGARQGGSRSVCVLDTNTLIDAHGFFEALFSLLLRALSTPSATSDPFVVVIPHFVLEELDGLKTNPRVGPRARDANRMLLRALNEQSRLGRQLSQRGGDLPRHRCPLLVERANESIARSPTTSVDASLVLLCHTLQRQTDLPVLFCSNDTNARTRAEIEGVQTFDLAGVLRASATVRARRKDEARKVRRMEGEKGVDRSSGASIWSSSAGETSRRRSEGMEARGEEGGYSLEAPEMLLEQWAVQLERGGGENGVEQSGSAAIEASRPGISLPPVQATAPQQQPLLASYDDDDGMDLDAAEEQPDYRPTQPSASHAHNYNQQPGSKKTHPREESLDALSKTTAARAEAQWDPELAKKRSHSGTNWSWAGDSSSDRGGGYRNGGGRTLRALPSSGRAGSEKKSTASSAWAAPSSRS